MKISVSVTDGRQDCNLWAKAVSAVDLSGRGGYALIGDFIPVIPDQLSFSASLGARSKTTDYTLNHHLNKGAPIVVCLTFSVKGEKIDSDRVCFLCTASDGANQAASYNADDTEVIVKGDIEFVEVHGVKALGVKVETQNGTWTNNPYYWAAKKISETPALMKKLSKSTGGGDQPLSYFGRKSIKVGDRVVSLPPGYEFAAEMAGSGIWLIACVIPNQKKLQFADILANYPGTNNDIAWFMEQQAALLEGMAMTYRIIGMSKSGKEL